MNGHEKQPHTSVLKQTILQRIHGEHIEPVPSAVHQFRNYGFWALWFLSILFGSLAVAVLIFTELNVGWEFYEATHSNGITFFVSTLPYLWLSAILAVALLGYFNLRSTKRGYKYPLFMIVAVGVVISTVGGIVFHAYGVGKHVEYELAEKLPFHKSVAKQRQDAWLHPLKGMYAGDVEVYDTAARTLVLHGFDGKEYTFDTEFLYAPDAVFAEVGKEVSIIALPFEGDVLQIACRLMPWLPPTALTLRDVREKREHVRERFIAYEDTRTDAYGYMPTFAAAETESYGEGEQGNVMLFSMADDASVRLMEEETVADADISYEDEDASAVGTMAMSAPAMDTMAMKAAPAPMDPEEGREINAEALRTNPCMDLYRSHAVPVR